MPEYDVEHPDFDYGIEQVMEQIEDAIDDIFHQVKQMTMEEIANGEIDKCERGINRAKLKKKISDIMGDCITNHIEIEH